MAAPKNTLRTKAKSSQNVSSSATSMEMFLGIKRVPRATPPVPSNGTIDEIENSPIMSKAQGIPEKQVLSRNPGWMRHSGSGFSESGSSSTFPGDQSPEAQYSLIASELSVSQEDLKQLEADGFEIVRTVTLPSELPMRALAEQTGSCPLPQPNVSATSGTNPAIATKRKSVPWDFTENSRPATRVMIAENKVSREPPKRSTSGKKIEYSTEQKHVLKLATDGKSIFFTGAAGTGKSTLLHSIIQALRAKYSYGQVAVTASTGLAAVNIGGNTLHSWSKLGVAEAPVDVLVARVLRNQEALKRWRGTKALILDEVSMVDGGLFDKFEEVARRVRKNSLPFGGIQLIVTGDFFQLPPVAIRRASVLCFEAKSWSSAIEKQVILTEVFRQQGDSKLISMLNAMREGNITDEIAKQFRELEREVRYSDNIAPTMLYPTRRMVQMANDDHMRRLEGRTFTYQSTDSGIADPAIRTALFKNFMALEKLELKIGAQVILISNIDAEGGMVNGLQGRVLTFVPNESAWFRMAFDQDLIEIYNCYLNFPVRDDVKCKLEALAPGQRSLIEELSGANELLPVVRFSVQGAIVDRVIERHEFSVKAPPPKETVIAARHQYPLILSWALSIHKAQGQTLERVIVDLKDSFETGQAYVAVSRATSTERLQILGFHRNAVKVDSRVTKFYKTLAAFN